MGPDTEKQTGKCQLMSDVSSAAGNRQITWLGRGLGKEIGAGIFIPQVHAERSDICACFARHPEHKQAPVVIELDDLALMDLFRVVSTLLAAQGENMPLLFECGADASQQKSEVAVGTRQLPVSRANLRTKK